MSSVPHIPQAPWFSYIRERMTAMQAEDTIDPTVPAHVWNAITAVFDYTTPTPSVVAGEAVGELALVWHRSGWDIQIDIGPQSVTVWAEERASGHGWSGDLSAHRSATRQLLAQLHKLPTNPRS